MLRRHATSSPQIPDPLAKKHKSSPGQDRTPDVNSLDCGEKRAGWDLRAKGLRFLLGHRACHPFESCGAWDDRQRVGSETARRRAWTRLSSGEAERRQQVGRAYLWSQLIQSTTAPTPQQRP